MTGNEREGLLGHDIVFLRNMAAEKHNGLQEPERVRLRSLASRLALLPQAQEPVTEVLGWCVVGAVKMYPSREVAEQVAERHRLSRPERTYTVEPVGASPVVSQSWRPIETAPKDGTHILAWFHDESPERAWLKDDQSGISMAAWVDQNGGGWASNRWGEPTHWMPLPPPPGASPVASAPESEYVEITCVGCDRTGEMPVEGDTLDISDIEGWSFTSDAGWRCRTCASAPEEEQEVPIAHIRTLMNAAYNHSEGVGAVMHALDAVDLWLRATPTEERTNGQTAQLNGRDFRAPTEEQER